jgi:RNA polymerase sigma factor (sigma-70 family)
VATVSRSDRSVRRSDVVASTIVELPPFEAFLLANRATVARFLQVAVGPAHADDVFQETFLAALRAYPRVRDPARLDRWILKIASRKAIDHHRGAGKRPTPTDEPPELAAEPVEPADDVLWKAVGELPPKQRIAVVHRHVLDRPYEEIAELLGCSPQAARANVYQGTKRLRELMG